MYRFTILTFVTLSFVISAVYALEDALTSVRQRTRLRARQFTDHPDWYALFDSFLTVFQKAWSNFILSLDVEIVK